MSLSGNNNKLPGAALAAPGPSLDPVSVGRYETVIAVKRARDVLLDAGVIPDWVVTRDDVPERLQRAFRQDVSYSGKYLVGGHNGLKMFPGAKWWKPYCVRHDIKLGSGDYALSYARNKLGLRSLDLFGFDNFVKTERFRAMCAAWTDTVVHVHL